MQYTVRKVSKRLDQALRQQARRERKSLNEFLLMVLERGLGLGGDAPVQRDLSDVVGTWREDAELDRILAEQRRIDPTLWK